MWLNTDETEFIPDTLTHCISRGFKAFNVYISELNMDIDIIYIIIMISLSSLETDDISSYAIKIKAC